MLRNVFGLTAAFALFGTLLVPASAQTIPSGSYQQSCTNVRVRGNVLTARCTNSSGGTVRSTINLSSCGNGDIANSNGQLTCAQNYGYGNGNGNGHRKHHGRSHDDRDNNGNGNGYGYGRDNNHGNGNNDDNNGRNNGYGTLPASSYRQSCTGATTRGSILTATCPTGNGTSTTTTINAAACNGADIANINGRLQCR